jgi:hypothetical protein
MASLRYALKTEGNEGSKGLASVADSLCEANEGVARLSSRRPQGDGYSEKKKTRPSFPGRVS